MEDLERQFLYRLLLNPYSLGVTETVHVGQVPPDFPVPLPASSRVLGSTQRIQAPLPLGTPRFYFASHTRVLLDSPLPPLAFLGQLRGLLGEGWEEEAPPGFLGNGFLPALPPEHVHQHSADLQLALQVTAREVDGVTQVDLNVSHDDPEQRQLMRLHHGRMQEATVRVRVPVGTTVETNGGGGGGGSWHYSALISQEQTAAALLDHFAPQLIQQGWAEVHRGTEPQFTTGSWVKTQGGQGVLLLTLEPLQGNYLANLRVIQS
ncbi:hypothetical protein [Deinococcus aestuarii]|uniref:hypothetical protein n=1 Tax=Deinococcus aestuarii TaxID=2774531 RepID=UPI001C0C136D|nr:hypothetical protein [Deinococcus aestuarii]